MASNAISMSDLRQLTEGFKLSSLAVPAVILLILTMLILPLPPVMLDVLFTLNILLALLVIMVAINTATPMEFSSFPTVILFSTMLRLGLNVASTRVVLLEGHTGGDAAGQVIEAFGAFVIGGNYVVGFIVFAILMIINFIVITKGAGRSSEVAARFTLDAMPGRQMAIDADLNAGIIDQDEAKARRALVSQESDFYGTMDGASKFVRGDAVAGILILLINLVGGVTIGLLQYDLSFDQATKAYVLLTIGDGLVAQIPALILSLSTALIVTRVTTTESAPEQAANQLANPAAFYIAGSILVLLGIIPGMPNLVFLLLGACALGLGYLSQQKLALESQQGEVPVLDAPQAGAAPKEPNEVDWDDAAQVDVVSLELGYGLIPMVDGETGGRLLNRIKGIRKKLSAEMGFLLPSIRVRDNLDNAPDSYSIIINGSVRGSGNIESGREMAINPGNVLTQIEGSPAKEPAFGLDAVWIDPADREYAQASGYTVVDPGTVIATHLNAVIQNNAAELMTFDVAQELLDRIEQTSPKLIEDLVPEKLPLGAVVQILQNLLNESVPLRDMRTILETLASEVGRTQNPQALTAAVRPKLGRLIVQQIIGSDETLPVMTLEPDLEQLLNELVGRSENVDEIALEPNLADGLFQSVRESVQQLEDQEMPAVIVVSPLIRPWLARLLRRVTRDLTVLSYIEIPEDQAIRVISTISINRTEHNAEQVGV
ncbi:MAG: flagellar biosynthesis protein FlhA [Gammaproteobacteria bacterium TMED92]|nr:MAG: flagellar biosynthesis protein FlhA [Gammaproteobacteria bacterium TMED92]